MCIRDSLNAHQHTALVGVTCSDVRLVSPQGHLLHADLFRSSGAWKQDLQHVPPLATRLWDWVAPPLSACMFRRTAFLDAFFAQAHSMPEALQAAGTWLCFQLAHHTSGALRIRETLTTCQVPDGAAASYGFFSAPHTPEGSLLAQPPLREALSWFQALVLREPALFKRWLPPAWHQRFGQWVQLQAPANGPV